MCGRSRWFCDESGDRAASRPGRCRFWQTAEGAAKRQPLLILRAMFRLLGRLPLRHSGFLHCFPLFLGQLPRHFLLVLGRLTGPVHVFVGSGVLSLNRHRARNTQSGQQKESSKSFHNVSEQRSCSDLTPIHGRVGTRGRYFCNSTSGGWEAPPSHSLALSFPSA